MPGPAPQPELTKFTAYTEPTTFSVGEDAAGNPITYPTNTIIALEQGEGTRRAGSMDVTHAERRELALPREVGGAVMDVLEHQGILTCHGFAHRLTLAPEENAKRGNTAMDMVTPGYETTTLATGERGLVGDPHHPVTDYTNGKIISVPGEALHSVVGLGPDSSEVIELPDFSARPSITSTDALLTAYQQRTGSKDTTLHRVAPPAPPITVDPVQYAMNPFGER